MFAKARENARRISCASNLKQIGLGIAQYTQDNDESLPMVRGNVDGTKEFQVALDPSIKSAQVWPCPSNSAKTGDAAANHIRRHYKWATHGGCPGNGFGYNTWMRRPLAS